MSFREPLTAAESESLHFCEVELVGDYLVTSGMIGSVGVATGTGDFVADAAAQANALAGKVVVPNLRYRTDINERVIRCDLQRLRTLGYVP